VANLSPQAAPGSGAQLLLVRQPSLVNRVELGISSGHLLALPGWSDWITELENQMIAWSNYGGRLCFVPALIAGTLPQVPSPEGEALQPCMLPKCREPT